jgi:hypothetical protein
VRQPHGGSRPERRAGFLQALDEMDEAWNEWYQELDEFVDAGAVGIDKP